LIDCERFELLVARRAADNDRLVLLDELRGKLAGVRLETS
jgi:hypothetical protein